MTIMPERPSLTKTHPAVFAGNRELLVLEGHIDLAGDPDCQFLLSDRLGIVRSSGLIFTWRNSIRYPSASTPS
jgi:hypothetical protein